MKRTLRDAARVVGGELIGEDRPFGCVSTDSRTLKPGSLFVALRGPNFDGSAFVPAAAAQGAIGALVEHATPGALPQVVVPDALRALQVLATHWRADFSLPVVAVAGSAWFALPHIACCLTISGSCARRLRRPQRWGYVLLV